MTSIAVEDESVEGQERREDVHWVGVRTEGQLVVPQTECRQAAQPPEGVALEDGDAVTGQVQLPELPQLSEGVVGDLGQHVARQEKRGNVQRDSSRYLVQTALGAVDEQSGGEGGVGFWVCGAGECQQGRGLGQEEQENDMKVHDARNFRRFTATATHHVLLPQTRDEQPSRVIRAKAAPSPPVIPLPASNDCCADNQCD